MRAVLLSGTKEQPSAVVGSAPAPQERSGRLIVEVVAAGVTLMEPHWITGWETVKGAPRKSPVVLGEEFAGYIHGVPVGDDEHVIGQRVLGMTDPYEPGAMADYVSARSGYVLPLPEAVSFEDASTLSLAGLTAWQAIVRHGELKRGEKVLIQGGAGGVGTFAIQIARWIGAHVLVTAKVQDEALCRRLGADLVIDYQHQRFEDYGADYDLVFDQIGGETQERSWSLLKRGGRLVTIAGERSDAPDQGRAHKLGVTAIFSVVEKNVDELAQLLALVVNRDVRPVIGAHFNFASIEQFYDGNAPKFAGKAVLAVGSEGG